MDDCIHPRILGVGTTKSGRGQSVTNIRVGCFVLEDCVETILDQLKGGYQRSMLTHRPTLGSRRAAMSEGGLVAEFGDVLIRHQPQTGDPAR